MYYKRFEIDNYLNCPKCIKRYDVPIGLPCGNCICESCLQQLTYTQTMFIGEKSSWEVECPLCNEKHEVPQNGFPIQKTLSDILKLNPSKETHDIVSNEFKHLLNEAKTRIDNLKSNFKESEEKIKEHSTLIKREIHNRIEILLKLIDKHEQSLMDKLNDIENENTKNVNENIEKIIKNVNSNLNDWNLLINNENSEKQKIKLASIDAIRLIESLDKNIVDLNNLLNESLDVEFEVNNELLNENIVGQIKFDSVDVSSTKLSNQQESKEQQQQQEGQKEQEEQREALNDDKLFNMTSSAESNSNKRKSESENDVKDDKSSINFTANESGVSCKTQ